MLVCFNPAFPKMSFRSVIFCLVVGLSIISFFQETSMMKNLTARSGVEESGLLYFNETFPAHHHDETNATSRPKTILYYNDYYHFTDMYFGIGQQPFLDYQCPVHNCYATNNKSYHPSMSEFDAIVFSTTRQQQHHNQQQLWGDDTIKWRRAHQRFVLFQTETPIVSQSYFAFDSPALKNFFNWTMTYRLDSDIPRLSGWFEELKNESSSATLFSSYSSFLQDGGHHARKNPDYVLAENNNNNIIIISAELAALADRPKKVAWIVSHCETHSRREHYVMELKKYIEVDVFGKCFNGTRCDKVYDNVGGDNCSIAVKQDYKFYLSFENSFCNDYITEKFFLRAAHNSLPIVYGQANYSRFAPPHSYVDALDFETPKDLAVFLHELDSNKTLYLSYFWWKDHYKVVKGSLRENHAKSFCKLCEKLNNDNEPTKSYSDIYQWWVGGSQCGLMQSKAWPWQHNNVSSGNPQHGTESS